MGKAPRPAVVKLQDEELEVLNGPWAGGGGFQSLAPKLRAKVTSEGELPLDDEEVGIIMRHMSYANSGFRGRLRKVFKRCFMEMMERK